LEGARLIDPSPVFWNIGHSPVETSLRTPSPDIESNVLSNFSVCVHGNGTLCGIKLRCCWEQIGNLEGPGCLLPQLDQKFEKEKEKAIASQEFSYFTDIYIRSAPINDA
jgi:hypothetical protein